MILLLLPFEPMTDKLFGRKRVCNAVREKAPTPMLLSPSYRLSEDSFPQPKKARSPTSTKLPVAVPTCSNRLCEEDEGAIVTFDSAVQDAKACKGRYNYYRTSEHC